MIAPASSPTRRVPLRTGGAYALATATMMAAGLSVVLLPAASFALVGCLCLVLVAVHPPSRAVFVIFGGLLAFQSTNSLDQWKIFYLTGFVVSIGAALFT